MTCTKGEVDFTVAPIWNSMSSDVVLSASVQSLKQSLHFVVLFFLNLSFENVFRYRSSKLELEIYKHTQNTYNYVIKKYNPTCLT